MRAPAVLSAFVAALLLAQTGDVESAACCGRRRGGALAVGALAFAGGYAIGHHKSHHHGGGGCCNSCGGCGRRRRSIESFLEDPKIQETYKGIAAEDKDECGLRLVCELAQKEPQDLAQDERQILVPYRGAGPSDGSAYGTYDEAAWHGKEGHGCASNYPLCAYTAQQVMEEYRKYVNGNETVTA
ncbi:uncharacterized protein LOC122254552 [Penaeus japonicus]|uniref:uncharacterized protein LOC122254552 n=1 Tax=Penaeus japonicus TaxID=27405 RepID=UPI001C70E00F|nr:uncharacterized protein LOC122254552 [Penaeus japonicus]